MNLEKVFKNYAYYVDYADLKYKGFKFEAITWIALALGLSITAFIISFIMSFFILQSQSLTDINLYKISLIVFLVTIDLTIALPYFISKQKFNKIEKYLPDALKQMADTLKAGGTYEFSLRDIVAADYPVLSDEIKIVLRNLGEGITLTESLEMFSERIKSVLINRIITIIIQSIKAGASLAKVLEDVSEDMRDLNRIYLERKARTMLQVIFILFASAIIAPAIFGMISKVIIFLIEKSTGPLNALVQAGEITQTQLKRIITNSNFAQSMIVTLIQVYIVIEVFASSIMISFMREGNASKSFIWFPMFLVLAFIAFFIGAQFVGIIIS